MNGFLSERGQGLVEYALILILIAIVVIIAVTALGTTTGSMFSDVDSTLESLTSLTNFISFGFCICDELLLF